MSRTNLPRKVYSFTNGPYSFVASVAVVGDSDSDDGMMKGSENYEHAPRKSDENEIAVKIVSEPLEEGDSSDSNVDVRCFIAVWFVSFLPFSPMIRLLALVGVKISVHVRWTIYA